MQSIRVKHDTFFLALGVLAFVALALGVVAPGANAQVTVTKAAGGNPELCVVGFDGPAAVREKMTRTLNRCNWFTVVQDAATAAYTVRARYADGALDVWLTERGGATRPWRVLEDAEGTDMLVYRAVDAVISGVFGNPGLCATRLAFVVGAGARKEIFTVNFDGSAARQETSNRGLSTEPSWGPGGPRHLTYTLYEHNTTTVVLLDLAQRRQRRLSHFRGLNSGAALSPDGQLAALTLSRDDRVDLHVMSVASRELRRLTNDVATESSPTWSPDGRRICYVSDRLGRPQLFVVPVAGGTPERVLSSAVEAVSPDWSATSNRIAFSTRADGRYALAVVDIGAGKRDGELVPTGPGDWEAPSWAPDGRHVICSHRVGTRRGLVMVDTWSGRALPVTQPDNHSLPSWSGLNQR